jgi:DNA-binding MurR/RpiR family transcriptional regulator
LRGALPVLGRAERAVADYVLAHPGRAVSASVSDLAKASGSAAGTVMRLCARLGFAGFPELKTALAVDLIQLGAPPSAILEAGQPPEVVIRQVLDLAAASLRETLHALDWPAAARAARLLAHAGRLDVYGAGGISGPLAQLARHRFLRLGIPGAAEVLAPAQLASAQTLRSGDAVLALSHSGVAVPIVDAVRAAKETGASVVAITNSHRSPLAEAADVALFTAAHEPAEWAEAPASRLPMFALFEALYAATALAREAGIPTERQK